MRTHLPTVAGILICAGSLVPFWSLAARAAGPAPIARQGPFVTIAPGKCTNSTCHPSENEWALKRDGDEGKRHVNAFNQLFDKKTIDKSNKYVKAAGLKDVLDPKGSCVRCHATVVTGRERDISDGVTCQSCHGPGGPEATSYLRPHQDIRRKPPAVETDKDRQLYEQSANTGLYRTRNHPETWTDLCVKCHVLGKDDRAIVDAGHPKGDEFDLSKKFVFTSKHWYLGTDKNYAATKIASYQDKVTGKLATLTAAAAPVPAAAVVTIPPPAAPPAAMPATTPVPNPRAPVPAPAPPKAAAPSNTKVLIEQPVAVVAPPSPVVAQPARAAPSPPKAMPAPPARAVPATAAAVPAPAALMTSSAPTTYALPQGPSAIVGVLQGRLASLLEALLRDGVQKKIAPPQPASDYSGPDAELLRLQQEIIGLALQTLATPPRASQPSQAKKDR